MTLVLLVSHTGNMYMVRLFLVDIATCGILSGIAVKIAYSTESYDSIADKIIK